jgi:hypothetical protein
MFGKPSENFPPLVNALAAFSMAILIAAALFIVVPMRFASLYFSAVDPDFKSW